MIKEPEAKVAESLKQIQEIPNVWDDGGLPLDTAAEFIGFNRTGVWKLIGDGLPSAKVGRKRVVPKRALVKFLELMAA